MAITKIQKNALPDPLDLTSVDLQIGNDEIVTANIADNNVTHAKLHTDMDLSGKTVTLPDQVTGDIGVANNASFNVYDANSEVSGRIRNWSSPSNSIAIESDPNNTAADSFLTFTIDGGRMMTIGSDGKVGIGTDSPSKKFAVSSSGANGIEISPDDTTTSTNRILSYNRSTNAFTPLSIGADDIRFYIEDSEKVRINDSGNVGIGTETPLQKLSINGRVSSDLNQDYYGAWFEGNTATNGDSFFAVGPWYTSSAHFEKRTGESYAHIYNYNSGHNLVLQAGSGDSGRASTTAGNVGIGTTSPQAKLHVTSSVLIEGGSTDSRTLGFTNASGSTGWSIGNGIIDSTHNFRIYDNTAGAARVTVDGSGNVGINTTSPSYTLDVNGKARAYGFIGHVIKEWNITGSYSSGTSYTFTTRSYINSLGWGDGMYRFVVYSDTHQAGISHYNTFVAYNAFYFVQQSSNAPQAFTMGWNVAMGHAPNTGTRAVDLVLRHRYGSASPNAADQQFEFIPVSALSNLTGGGGYDLKIRLFKIP